jgi:hypothetical protein
VHRLNMMLILMSNTSSFDFIVCAKIIFLLKKSSKN